MRECENSLFSTKKLVVASLQPWIYRCHNIRIENSKSSWRNPTKRIILMFQAFKIFNQTFHTKKSFPMKFQIKKSFENTENETVIQCVCYKSDSWHIQSTVPKFFFIFSSKRTITPKRMKLLQFTQKIFKIVGIDSPQNPFNRRMLMVFSVCCMSSASACVFLFHEAKNFMEYSNSIYITTAFLLVVVCYTILITKMEDTFELIDNLESTVEKSTFANELILHWFRVEAIKMMIFQD